MCVNFHTVIYILHSSENMAESGFLQDQIFVTAKTKVQLKTLVSNKTKTYEHYESVKRKQHQ